MFQPVFPPRCCMVIMRHAMPPEKAALIAGAAFFSLTGLKSESIKNKSTMGRLPHRAFMYISLSPAL